MRGGKILKHSAGVGRHHDLKHGAGVGRHHLYYDRDRLMRVSLFIIGLYLVVSAVMGNSLCVWQSVIKQAPFVYWIVAIGVLWVIWTYTPSPYDEAAHWLIGASILALLVVNAPKVKTDLSSFWTQIKGL